jgi:flagellar hook assembly protein FlgD
VLVIEGADVVANNELIIFDGRGKVVYQSRDYQNDWGGTDNSGKILPDGYYYFNFRGEGVDIKDYLIIKSSVY